EGPVAGKRIQCDNVIFHKNGTPKTSFARANPSKSTRPVVVPIADYQIFPFGVLYLHYFLAACSHHRIKEFHAMNAIPKQIGMAFFQCGGAIGKSTEHLSLFYFISVFDISK